MPLLLLCQLRDALRGLITESFLQVPAPLEMRGNRRARTSTLEMSVAQLLRSAERNHATLSGHERAVRGDLPLSRPVVGKQKQVGKVKVLRQALQKGVRIGNSQDREPTVGQLLRNAEKNRADLRRLGNIAKNFMATVRPRSFRPDLPSLARPLGQDARMRIVLAIAPLTWQHPHVFLPDISGISSSRTLHTS